MSMTIRGKEITTTAKAMFFHRYGAKHAAWYPLSTILARKEEEGGTLQLEVADWIYDKNDQKFEPGGFSETPHTDQPMLLHMEAQPTQPIAELSDDELLLHFDEVVSMLHDRGVDLEKHYE